MMFKNKLVLSCAAMVLAVTLSPAEGFAKDKGKSHGHGGSEISWDKESRDNDRALINIQIGSHDRQVIERYSRDHGHDSGGWGKCPPGLAKKRNGCLPPGQAKKYQVGRPLDRGIDILGLPDGLIAQLTPPPRGTYYGRVDNDVVLISRENRMIVDAVSLLLGQ